MRAMQHLDSAPSARGEWLVPVLAGLVAGTALQLRQPELWEASIYACFALLVSASAGFVAIKSRAPWLRVGMALLAGALLGFGATGWRATVFEAGALRPALEGIDLIVEGTVAAMPQRSDAGLRFVFDVDSAATPAGEPVALPPRLSVGWYGAFPFGASGRTPEKEPPEVRAGERWRLALRLKAPHGGVNPFGFDYELWLWERGIQATGAVRDGRGAPPSVRLDDGRWRHPVERARQAVRDAIVLQVADRPLAGVIAGLVTGDQNAIERADWDVYRATGVAHLMSISGLHITMFAWLAAALIGALWRRSGWLCRRLPSPTAALAGGLLLAGAYALFSGWGVPAQRTIWMLATAAVLRLAALRWPWWATALLAMAVVVAADPWALLQGGFWLSFVAVSVLFLVDPGREKDEQPDDSRARRFWRRIAGLLHEQWVVTVALTPLSLLLFNQVSIVGLVANLLAIPWVTLVVTPLAMLGVIAAPLWTVAAQAVRGLGWWLQWLAGLPLATVSLAAPPLWAGVAGVAGGVLLAMRLPWRARLLGLPLLLPVLLWQVQRPLPGEFDLLAADIGQGNAVLVRTATHGLLFDAGPRFSADSDAGHRVLLPLLRALDERLDLVMLSHRDLDHVGGAPAVLAMQPQAALTSSVEPSHALWAQRPGRRCEAGQRWSWDGVAFEVLHPAPADYDQPARSNAMSCVLRVVSAGGRSALLAGDLEAAQEAKLVAAGAPLAADWLLVPHHGSKTSSSGVFLDAVKPGLAVVQAGYRNRFGHPAPEVLTRYSARGIAVVDSSHCGAQLWRSGEPAQAICQRTDDLRYWRHRPPG